MSQLGGSRSDISNRDDRACGAGGAGRGDGGVDLYAAAAAAGEGAAGAADQTPGVLTGRRGKRCCRHSIVMARLVRIGANLAAFVAFASCRAQARHPRLAVLKPRKGVDGGPSAAMTTAPGVCSA